MFNLVVVCRVRGHGGLQMKKLLQETWPETMSLNHNSERRGSFLAFLCFSLHSKCFTCILSHLSSSFARTWGVAKSRTQLSDWTELRNENYHLIHLTVKETEAQKDLIMPQVHRHQKLVKLEFKFSPLCSHGKPHLNSGESLGLFDQLGVTKS